jgi:HrpA-like RNA helicase
LGARGDTTTILCSQPRRVAAISVAERVSDEMCEDSVGRLVGYQIRLESRRSSETRLLFCTTGVILRRLVEDPTLKGISHVIVDEVHERQWQIDVLLVSLRALLQGTRSDLKVVLMSATLDADLFRSFFGGAPLVTVPGRTFPVATYHLEDILEATNHIIEEHSRYALRQYDARETVSMWVSTKGGERKRQTVSLDSELGTNVSDRYPGFALPTRRSMDRVDESQINYDLIEDLLEFVLLKNGTTQALSPPEGVDISNGALLIFLPGVGEIKALSERLRSSRMFGDARWFTIVPLHSLLSSAEQRRAFEKPLNGRRNIILSTNIAETSVTIPDVVCGK